MFNDVNKECCKDNCSAPYWVKGGLTTSDYYNGYE